LPVTQAGVFNVTLSADLLANDFVINDADGAIFGVTPTDTSFSVTIQVDTGAGVDSASAGDPTDTFTFGHDVWGYNSVSVLSATFGTKTWTDADIVLLDFDNGIDDSDLFLDAELGVGTPTLASFRVEDSDGFAFFGVRACGVSCDILQGLQIRDFDGAGLDNALNDYVLADTYSISVSAVPVPAAVWLFGTALIGLVGFGKRRKAA
jgi:hypothetical protein